MYYPQKALYFYLYIRFLFIFKLFFYSYIPVLIFLFILYKNKTHNEPLKYPNTREKPRYSIHVVHILTTKLLDELRFFQKHNGNDGIQSSQKTEQEMSDRL